MKEWFTGEEEGEGEGTAPQQRSSLRGNTRLPVTGSEGSTLCHGDSVLQCGGGDVPSPPLLSLMTSRHSSDRGLSDSDTVCQSCSGRTPLLDQVSLVLGSISVLWYVRVYVCAYAIMGSKSGYCCCNYD